MQKEIQYYNYIYLDPRKPGKYSYENLNFCLLYEPFYVGKGKSTYNRHFNHIFEAMKNKKNSPKENKIRKILKTGFDLKEYVIKLNFTKDENEALMTEYTIIKEIGLENLTNIQNELVGKDVSTNDRNKKISKKLKGKPKSEEHKENMRKPKSEEHKENISKGRKGIKFSETHLKNMSECRKGKPSKLTEEGRRRKSEASKWNNCNSITVEIYDNNDNLFGISYYSIYDYCKEHNLPTEAIKKSYLNNGKRLYQTKCGITKAIKTGNIKYQGWYAIKISK